ncbi:MAG: hypothetical protein KC416_03200, partial [Myxococcales bacterium]|nr:hypothetical protein [Myxococcales bacterium]
MDVRNKKKGRIGTGPIPRGLALTLLLSVLLHGAVVLFLSVALDVPDLEIEFAIPAEVEFGTAEGMIVQADEGEAAPEKAVDEETPPEANRTEEDQALAAAEAAEQAAARAEARRRAQEKKARLEAERIAREAAAQQDKTETEKGTEAQNAEIPPGAHIALRLDMKRVR